MKRQFAIGRALLLFAICVGAMSAGIGVGRAAEITAHSSESCNVRLSGPIVAGDAVKLRTVIQRVSPGTDYGRRVDICLNSTDGSYAEVLEMIKLFTYDGLLSDGRTAVGTVVEKGAECYGPCALLLMRGRFAGFHGTHLPLRRLHVGGRLGFRTLAPGDAGGQDQAAIARAFAQAVRHIAQIMQQNADTAGYLDRQQPYPRSLTVEVLKLPPGKTLLIETLEQASRWNIQIMGLPKPRQVTTAMLWDACDNYAVGQGSGPAQRAKRPAEGTVAPFEPRLVRRTFSEFGANGRRYCIVDQYGSAKFGPLLHIEPRESLTAKPGEYQSSPASIKEFLDQGGSDYAQYEGVVGEPLWLLYPRSTAIRDVPQLMLR